MPVIHPSGGSGRGRNPSGGDRSGVGQGIRFLANPHDIIFFWTKIHCDMTTCTLSQQPMSCYILWRLCRRRIRGGMLTAPLPAERSSAGSLWLPLLAPRQAPAATQQENHSGQGLVGIQYNAFSLAIGHCSCLHSERAPPHLPTLLRGAKCPLGSSSRGSDRAGDCVPVLLPPLAACTTA